MSLRPDLAVIARHVAPRTRVLDVGCGEGELMAELQASRQVDARGLELDPVAVERCVARGLSAVQGNADRDLADYPDKAFDYAILSQTLQTARRPDVLLDELLRIGASTFVSFPNFAYWRNRLALLWRGRMPVTRNLPVSWYETENIHHLTVGDFDELLARLQVTTERRWFFANDREIAPAGANWRAEHAVYLLRR
jgi:methionine biosynthesis protein MetW